MKVHLLRMKHGQFLSFLRTDVLIAAVILLMGVKSVVLAEGSKDFVNYPGYRMFLDTRDPQQLKVYANEGETINVGSSHVGIQGGFITVYDPSGTVAITFNNSGATTGLAIINNNIEEVAGPTGGGTTGGNGYRPGTITVPAGMAGIWTVVFDYPFYSNAGYTNLLNNAPWTRAANQPNSTRVVLAWDITVTQGGAGNNGGTPVEGRVYSNEHISLINGNGFTTSPIFYVLTEDGYLYEVDINEADPFRFPISSNSFGLVNSDIVPIYKSKPEADFIRSNDPSSWTPGNFYLFEPQAQGVGSITNNKIFFNIPDPDLPRTAMVTDIFRSNTHDTWLMDDLQILTIDSLYLVAFSDSGSPCNPGTIEFQKGGYFVFETNLGGVVTLQLDLNGNGLYTDPVDTTLMGSLSEGLDSIYWNGYNGLGDPISVQDSLIINYQGTIRFGELHIALTDVEGNPGGVTFEWLNAPSGFPTDQFYYDHSDIGGPVSGGGTPGNALPTNIPYTYPVAEGNDDYIDQWFFIEQVIPENTIQVNVVLDCFCDPQDIPVVSITGDEICAGEALVLSATNSNTTNGLGLIDYSWTGPNGYSFNDPDIDPAGTSVANVADPSTAANAGTYQVIGTTSALCADTASLIFNINPTPVLEADDLSPEVCEGGSIQICATNVTPGIGQMTCNWTGPNGFDETDTVNGTDQLCIQLTNVSTSFEGDYVLVCTADGCASDSLVITLDIQPTPEINGTSPNGNFCVGEDVVLTASNNVQGTGPIIYTWTGPNFTFTDTTTNVNGPFNATITSIQLSDEGDYTLVLSTLAGCESTPQTITIGVNEKPLICNVIGGGDACVGQTVTLVAFNCTNGLAGSFDYAWTGPGGAPICSGTQANSGPYICEIPNIQPGQSGQYCFNLTHNNSDCSADEFCIDINVLPSINIFDVTSDSAYCEGSNVALTASTNFGGAVIYTWTGPNGLVLCTETVAPGTPLSCTIVGLNAASAGNYILTVASLDGCEATPVTVSVGLLDGVDITATSGGGTYCDGEDVILSGTGSSNSLSVFYQWTDPNGQVVGEGTTPPAGPYDATVTNPVEGTYTLTVTTVPDMCGDTATVNVQFSNTPIGNIITPNDTTLCELDSLLLCAQNTNPEVTDFTYTWTTPSGETITGAGSGTDVFCDELDPINTFGEGFYTLVICSGGCCSDPDSININLNPNPVMSTVTGGGTYCEGDTATICFSNTNPEVLNWFYTCNIDTIQTTGMGTGTNQICLDVTTSTFIFCSLESVDGCVSDLLGTQVIFEPNYTPEVTANDPVCANETLQLNGSNNSTCQGDVTYTWTGPGGFTFSGTAPCTGPFPAEDSTPVSGEYCLTLDSGNSSNCSEPACVTVTVNDLPTVVGGTINGGGEFCEEEDLILTATIQNPSGGDINYEWTLNGDVVATGTAGSGEMISLVLSPIDSADAGEYCLNLTCVATGCSDEGLGCTQVIVNTTPTIHAVTGSGTYCQDFDVMLNGSGPAGPGQVNYTWTGPNYSFTGTAPCGGPYPATVDNIDLDQAGIYTLVVTKGNCTSEPAELVIEVNPTPDITNVTASGEACAGDPFPIGFTIDPDGAASVNWTISGPGLNESGTVTTLTDFDFDIIVNENATYVITAVSDLGCEADPMNISITEIMVPVPVITVDPDMPCPGDMIVLSTTPVQNGTFTWCLNGSQISGPSPNPSITVTAAEGTYTVKVTLNGCTVESAPAIVTFPASPTANDDSFTTDAGVPVSGNILTNDDTVTGVTVGVTLQPSNGTVTVGQNGEMTYTPDPGFSGTDQFTYEICSLDCPEDCDEAVVTIIVNLPPCEVPNVITPNGDDVNDILIIDCVPAYPNNSLRIFNRWGDEIEVFEPYTNTWDGTIGSGKDPVPAGTYFYIFREDRSSDDHKAGYIKVVR